MASREEVDRGFSALGISTDPQQSDMPAANGAGGSGVQVACFTEEVHDVSLHFQIIRLVRQIFVWIGCNSAKFGHLYAASNIRPNNTATVTSLLRGTSDNTGVGIARRLVLKTGLSIIVACNISKDSPMLEAAAERKLMEKLRSLGYTKPKLDGVSVALAS